MSTVKEEARELIDGLPEQATWDDLMYRFYIRKKVDAGLKAAEQGDIVSHEEVKRRFLNR
jgi:predicted transcriptional regulator